ncbi:MAG TPA: NifU family protein [Acidimicrobiales bacterium]|nr:NifU family protein [Acidimicrobiales bacterium]
MSDLDDRIDPDDVSYVEAWARMSELADELLAHPDQDVVRQVEELLDWVDAFHRDGLGRLVEMVRGWRGDLFLDSVANNEITGTMLAAYGLGQGQELQTEATAAVDAALDDVRPLVESHGGALEVASVKDGVVTLRMLGTCDGCPSSSATLTYGVEAALREHWPHFRRLELLDPPVEVDPDKADLECLTVPDDARPGTGAAQPAPVQIRGHER